MSTNQRRRNANTVKNLTIKKSSVFGTQQPREQTEGKKQVMVNEMVAQQRKQSNYWRRGKT
jgi:hypothetical protein